MVIADRFTVESVAVQRTGMQVGVPPRRITVTDPDTGFSVTVIASRNGYKAKEAAEAALEMLILDLDR